MFDQIFKKSENRVNLRIKVIAGSVIILAIILRFYGLGNESAWIDEAYSINLSGHSIAQILQGTAADQHPPLYYLLLHLWLRFGNGVPYARLLSALMGVLLVVQSIVFGWKISGAYLGLGTGLLIAISPLAVWYSQEARQYMLLACLTTASTFFLWQSLRGRSHWVLYWLFSTLSLYTQYFSVFIFFAQAIIAFIWAYRQQNKRLLFPWLISIIGVGLAFLPWLPVAKNQFMYHTMPWITDPSAGQIRDVVLALLLGNGINVLPELFRFLIFISIALVIGWSAYRLKNIHTENRASFLFLIIWALVPLIIISVLSVIYPVFQLKQFLIILTPLLMLVVLTIFMIKLPWGSLLFVGLLIINGFTLVYQQVTLTKDDWRGAAAYIEDNAMPGDMIYANPAASSLALNLYLESRLPFDGYPPDYDILTGGWKGEPMTLDKVDHQLTLISREFHRIWLIEFFPEFWDTGHELESWLTSHGHEEKDISFGKIRLRLYNLVP